MIDPIELRLNNIVQIDGIITTVSHIMGDEDYFEPVELTPEILEAAGFKYNELTENYEIYIDFEGLIALNKYDYSTFIGADNEDRGYTGRTNTACKYLHQLQNLYWCLCGQELQIDITKLNK